MTAVHDPDKSAREEIEARLRKAMGSAGFAADALIGHLRSLGAAAATADGPRPEPWFPATEGAMRAAVSHTFTLGEVGEDRRPGFEQADLSFGHIVPRDEVEQRALLAHSTTVLIDGRRRLMLTDAARARVINAVRSTPEFQRVLREAGKADVRNFDAISDDPVRLPSAWLRSFLTGEHGILERAPAREVRAALDALECLQGVAIKGPSLDTARRLRDLAELLEPLRLLVGQRRGWDGKPAVDRFVGREDELTTLRAFVDELASQSTLESVSRFVGRAARGAQALLGGRDESVFFIDARGGLGKSTLVAKFMLDHALSQTRPFPFAYLDFDRAAIRPRDPLALLSEVARQVSLQDPGWQGALADFRARLRDEMAGTPRPNAGDPFAQFRDVVRNDITQGDRPFLVVMDTMEVVQYDPLSIDGITAFQGRLASGDSFPELKIVASGRADVPELRTGPQERSGNRRITLKPLGVKEARAMAGKLGQWLMPHAWRDAWARDIAGRSSDPPERREPLTLRVAVELLRDTDADKRPGVAHEIARSGEFADESFVGRLYERRILNHIRDLDVRRLSWPGLVFRRVTSALIRDPLAALCGIDPTKADALFHALANEVWMVERVGADAVRHRPDLRARTLPMMMRRRPEPKGPDFATVNRAAIRHYAQRRDDPSAYAEWLYHRLLDGEDCASVDADWTPESADLLRGAADDFARGSPQRSYLLSRTATRLLPPSALLPLPTVLALDHVARTGQQLGRFDDLRIQPIVMDLAARLPDPDAATTLPHPVRAVLLVKTGQWSVPAAFAGGTGEWEAHAEFAARFLRARLPAGMLARRWEITQGNGVPLLSWDALPEPGLGRKEVPLRAFVQDLAHARLAGASTGEIDWLVAQKIRATRPSTAPSDIAALRTAVVFGRACSREAARVWLETHRDNLWRHLDPCLSLAELDALLGTNEDLHRFVRAEVPGEFGATLGHLVGLANAGVHQPMRVSHPVLAIVIGGILDRLLADPSEAAARQLRRFFAARDEDWIVPIGYALARIPPEQHDGDALVADRLASYDAARRKGLLDAFRESPRPPKDPLRLLRLADEASDLGGVASLLAKTELPGAQTSQLRLLVDCHATWRAGIARILDEG